MIIQAFPSFTFSSSIFLLCLFQFIFHGVAGVPTRTFKSRPDLNPPIFVVQHSTPTELSPGYFFVTPSDGENPGPHIFDNYGNLVWTGWGNSGPGISHGMHVCPHEGKDHLCFFQGAQAKGYARGHGLILDNHYRIVRSVQPGGGMSSSDMHEFKPIGDGKTALMTVYQQRQFDMSTWNIKAGMGWVMESIFQEVDVETSEELFEWRSLDHVDPSATYTWPDHTDTSGNGLEAHSSWDYFHINSIDKNADGDYLISSRHTCAVYKVSGKDGSVIWRLHGANPSFRNINFSFSQQHDARWLSENSTHTLLSLYNNGYNGFNQTHVYSSSMVILIDHRDMTATMIKEYAPYANNVIASSQGNTQVLKNKHVVTGWGNTGYVSEHNENGDLIFWALIGNGETMNYRAQKFEWEGYPSDSPAMWTYSKSDNDESPMTFYISWNGATQIKTWRFYGAQNRTGPYTLLSEVSKRGFETSYTHGAFYPWTYAEAVDEKGNVLGLSSDKFTFVPSPGLRDFCTDQLCENTNQYGLPGEEGAQPIVPPMGIKTVPWALDEDVVNRTILSPGHQTLGNKQTGYKFTRGQLAWGIALLGVVIAIVTVLNWIYFRRPHRPQEKFNRLKERNSTEELNNLHVKPQFSSLPSSWWNPRRWMRNEEVSHKYSSLSGQDQQDDIEK
ncbi:ASST-domain-containing protein [Talaromyces proteolyticus]|uniref:ASST-domain-containing protein n=1 Tax=Talaromyces proteolyticus TaxID=1131652 RepID=A0AAD4KQC0_9EURO|nr:ASST-domain-containing protein [Talaromyces proteolyticus]KAH8696751.1 ASST-domain-containing protein [Talaromyces proteolyticus]